MPKIGNKIAHFPLKPSTAGGGLDEATWSWKQHDIETEGPAQAAKEGGIPSCQRGCSVVRSSSERGQSWVPGHEGGRGGAWLCCLGGGSTLPVAGLSSASGSGPGEQEGRQQESRSAHPTPPSSLPAWFWLLGCEGYCIRYCSHFLAKRDASSSVCHVLGYVLSSTRVIFSP